MAYHLTTIMGSTEREPTPERMAEVLVTLDGADEEHPDVSLTHESEWCISVFRSGLLIFENLEEGEPVHLAGVSREETLRLWQLLAHGDIASVQAMPWQPGQG